MGHPLPNVFQRDIKYFSEKIYLKKILLLLKLIHAIHYSDDFNQKRFYYPLLMGHEWPNEL